MVPAETNQQRSLVAEPLELLVGADDAYAMPLAVTLYSALERLTPGRRVNVTVIDGGLAKSNRERIEKILGRLPVKLTLKWIKADLETLRNLPVGQGNSSYLSKAMYFRLFAPDFIGSSRVIYLDSDTVVQQNLDELWATDMSGFAIAAVTDLTDYAIKIAELNDNAESVGDELQLAKQLSDTYASYFNSGVMLLDLAKWRDGNLTERVFADIKAFEIEYKYPDQDGLNAVFRDNWLALDETWNFQVNRIAFKHQRIAVDEARILHYSTRFKPWTKLSLGVERPYFTKYLRELERSRWFSPTDYFLFRAQLAFSFAKTVPRKAAAYLFSRMRLKTRAETSKELC